MATDTALLCLIIASVVSLGHCWMYYETLEDYGKDLLSSYPQEKFAHSEYKFGDCERQGLQFYTHVHLDSLSFLGKIFVRGWLDIRRIPTCIILRGKSFDLERMRSTSFAFQFCVPRIVYCHTHRRFRYYYYEWHLPYNYDAGLEWDIYFYGSPNLEW